jgi:hypothetical protein
LWFTGQEGSRVFHRLVEVIDELSNVVLQNQYSAEAHGSCCDTT